MDQRLWQKVGRPAAVFFLSITLTAGAGTEPGYVFAAKKAPRASGTKVTRVVKVKTKKSGEALHWKDARSFRIMEPGTSEQLALAEGIEEISFVSSDPNVAEVSPEGVVTAKQAGAARITASAAGASVSCEVYVGPRITALGWKNTEKRRTIEKKEKFRIKAAVTPADAAYRKLTFRSSNPKVAQVDARGTVYGRKNGRATITARTQDGSNLAVSCRVTVGKKVRKMTWKNGKPKMTMRFGEEKKFQLTFSPKNVSDRRVRFYSSNPGTAAVNSKGVVTAKRRGLVKITAAARDGSGRKLNMSLTVKNPLNPFQTHFLGHRGMPKSYPENTVESFRGAAGQKYWGVECDIWETKEPDGTTDLMVFHDRYLNRLTGYFLPVQWVNMQNRTNYPIVGGRKNDRSIRYLIPNLEEYIDAVDPVHTGKQLIIEMKDQNISRTGAEKFFETLRQKGVPGNKVTIIAFGKETLLTLRQVGQEYTAGIPDPLSEGQGNAGGRQSADGQQSAGNQQGEAGQPGVIRYDASGADYWLLMRNDLSEENTLQEISWAKTNHMAGVSVAQVMKDKSEQGLALREQKLRWIISRLKEEQLKISLGPLDDALEAKKYVDLGVTEITTNQRIWAKND